VFVLFAAGLVAVWLPQLTSPQRVVAAPGSPGVPSAPTVPFTEDFENGFANAPAAPSAPLLLSSYTGASGTTYTADLQWLTNCNGNILEWANTAAQQSSTNCADANSYTAVRRMAHALGTFAGAADPTRNRAVTAHTSGNPGPNLVQLESGPITLAGGGTGRFLTFSVTAAAINCFATPPQFNFFFRNSAGAETQVGTTVNACTEPGAQTLTPPTPPGGTASATPVRVVTANPDGSVLWPGGTVRLVVRNPNGSGSGNDGAFDNPRITDVTPQLDKEFIPALIGTNQVSRIRFTVTNTTELGAKNGFSFTDGLPAGVTVAPTPGFASTCPSTTPTGVTSGSSTVGFTASLNAGQTFCRIEFDVVAPVEGSYVNAPSDLTVNGLDLPNPATLTVLDPRITVTKALGTARGQSTDQFTMEIRSGSAAGPVVSDPTNATTTGTGGTVTAGSGTTGALQATVGTTFVLNEAGAGTTDLAGYARTMTCTDANGVQTGLPTDAVVPAAGIGIVPVLGADIRCTITNRLLSASVALVKTEALSTDANVNGRPDVGDQLTFSFLVTNTGQTSLSSIAIADQLVAPAGPAVSVVCPPGPLGAGASVTCTSSPYTVTAADVDAGSIANSATATGTPPSQPPVTSPPSTTSTPIPPAPAITLVKSASPVDDVDGNGVDAGDTVIYSFLVTNTGTVTLNAVGVTDPLLGSVNCPVTTLPAPGSTVCAAVSPYVLTQADVDAGDVANTATASGIPPFGAAVTDVDTLVVDLPATPAIEVVKTAGAVADVDGNGVDVGDTIDYTFTVANIGNVTLSGVAVADPLVGAISCPATTLAPGDTTVCTAASYTLTQADIDAGQRDNTATASGTPPTGDPVTDDDTVTVTLPSTPSISVVKSAGAVVDVDSNGLDAGDTIQYTFDVTNTGNVTLTSVAVTDPLVGTVTCPTTTLAPGAFTTCNAAPYVLTQGDIDAGGVDNTATVTGTPPVGDPVTDDDTITVPLSSTPSIAVIKSAGAIVDDDTNGADAGDTIQYSFEVTNTGNVTLASVAVSDPLVGAVTCPTTTLAPGESTTCTADAVYVLTQADVDAGEVNNIATVSGTPPVGDPVTDDDTVIVGVPSAPAIEVVKSAGAIVDVDSNVIDAGDTILYSFDVTNIGNVTLTSVAVADPLVGAVTCPVTTLAPGESTTCTADAVYVLTQADLDAGDVDNTASVSGTPPVGDPVTDDDTVTVPLPGTPGIGIVKTAGPIADIDGNGADAGDTIQYTFDVTNTGFLTLTGVVVTDPLIGAVTCTTTTLAPAESTTCTADAVYVLIQADLDAGGVTNTAAAVGDPPFGDPVSDNDTVTVPLAPLPTIEVIKTAAAVDDVDGNGADADDTIQYTFEVTNTGNVTLVSVAVSDPLVGAVTCPTTTLAPGESTTCTAADVYVLTQADIDAGQVDNTATATGTPPIGDPVTDDDTVTVDLPPAPGIDIVKTAGAIDDNDSNGTDAGDTIQYSFEVTNTGNVTLVNVAVSDPLVGAVTCPTITLAPGESTTCTADAEYALTQADIDAGEVNNTATATGTPPVGDPVTDDDTVTVDLPSSPSIDVVKTAGAIVDVDTNGADAGDTIQYSFEVTNTGTATLTNVAVSDPLVGAVTCPTTTLAPGESTTCTADAVYVLTQADVDAGEVNNTATVTGTPPIGDPVTDDDTVTVDVQSTPAISVVKSAGAVDDLDGNGVDAGDTIQYSFEVTNTGNVTLTNVAVTDPLVGDVTCPTTTLEPGESTTCTAIAGYVLTQADVDAGDVDNTATVTGTPPIGDPVTDDDTVTLPLPGTPGIDIVKTAGPIVDVDGNGADAGDTIQYTFEVTNTGFLTLTGIVVTDPLVGNVTCPATALAPGETTTCTADAVYVLTQTDLDAAGVTNTASVVGDPPFGDPVSDNDTVTVPLAAIPSIEVDKTAGAVDDVDGNGLDAGDTILYSFEVTNTGNVTLTSVAVSDPLVGAVTCLSTTLVPGESTNCAADSVYVLTQADVDAGQVVNTANVVGAPPVGDPVTDDDTVTVPLQSAPSINVVKSAGAVVDVDGNGFDAGDTIAYSFEVTNTGNVTLTSVAVSDPLVGAVTCPDSTLAPGDSTTCTADAVYVLTQADVDAGQVDNTATVTGTPPVGDPISDDDTVTVDLPSTSSMSVDKSAGAIDDIDSNGVDAGDTIAYSFEVTNTGNVTLTGVAVSDPMVGAVTCPTTTLAPGESITCSADAVYLLTPADIDAGSVDNTATVTGTPPVGDPVSDDDTVTVDLPSTPSISVVKSAGAVVDVDTNGIDAGDTIQYSFEVTNTGNVTLTGVAVSDPLVGSVTCPTTTLAPGDSTACTADNVYVLTQADVDAGQVDNTATVTGTPPVGDPVSDDSTVRVDLPVAPGITVDKTAGAIDDNDSNGIDAGDTILYSFEVTNTGNTTLTDVAVSDPLVGAVTCPTTTLAPGESTTCTADAAYILTQADINAAEVNNTAIVTGIPPIGDPISDDDTVTVDLPPAPGVEVVKTAGAVDDLDSNGVDAGDTILYSFEVTNTGNVTLTGVAVSDPMVGAVTCPTTTLAPGESTVCTADAVYVLTQTDVDAGSVDNTATVTGTPPDGDPIDDDDTVTVPLPGTPAISIDKTASSIVDVEANGLDAGDTIAYTFTVTNTGSVTLTGVAVTDPMVGAISCPSTTLAPGESTVCTAADYVLTQADVDGANLVNTASVVGTPPVGDPVSDDDTVTVPLATPRSITIEKTAGTVTDVDSNGVDVGDTILYSFEVTNTGNTTLTNVTVTDPKVGAVTCPTTTLAPGESTICTAGPYVLTQADLDAGDVDNTATVTGTPPSGDPPSDDDTVTTPFAVTSSISVVKSAGAVADVDGNGLDAGDTITYSFTVTNTGNTTLTNVTVTDPKVGVVTCPTTTLAPAESTVCTAAPYILTQADVDAGSVANTATVTGTPPIGDPVDDGDAVTVELPPSSAITVVKTAGAIDDNDSNGIDAGDTITYSFTVTNTGNTTLTAVAVDDPMVTAVTCPTTTLAPGESMVCTADPYVLTQADVNAGSLSNTATVTGTPPDGDPVDDGDTVTVTVPSTPRIDVVKTAGIPVDLDGNGTDVGDTVTFSFAVTNTGNVTLTSIAVSDPMVGTVTCPTTTLAPGESMACTAAPYVLRSADIAAGRVNNNATVTGTPPSGPPTSDIGTVTVSLPPPPPAPTPPAPTPPPPPFVPEPVGELPSTGTTIFDILLIALLLACIGGVLLGSIRSKRRAQ
jgi:uncharacterized repeat protein (TIGR01451 family)